MKIVNVVNIVNIASAVQSASMPLRHSRHSRYSRYSRLSASALHGLAALLLAFALAACGEKPPQLSPLGADDVILAFGDSLTYGTGAGPDEAYPKLLAQLINRRVVGAGVPGETTVDGLERLPAALDETRPRLLLLCMGGNDMLRKMDIRNTESNLRAMVQLARSRGVDVVLIGVPEPGLSPAPPAFFAAIAREFDLPYEEAAMAEVLKQNSLKSDLIHPNARGYRLIAERLAERLRHSGAI